MILGARDAYSLMNTFLDFILLNRPKQRFMLSYPTRKVSVGENIKKLEASIPYLLWKILIISLQIQ